MLEAPAGTGIYARRYRALTVGVLALVVLVAFESLAVATAMPMVGRDLDGLGLYALAFSGSMAAGMIATVLGGRWGDLRGPVAPLWAGLAAFVAGLLISGTAPGMDVFLLGRFVQGFGGGVFQVALYVLVSRVYPAGLHPKVFGALAAAWVVPSMVGPVIAGSVAVHLGWRWVFLGVPLLVAPAALLLWRGLGAAPMEERDGEGSRRPHADRPQVRLGGADGRRRGAHAVRRAVRRDGDGRDGARHRDRRARGGPGPAGGVPAPAAPARDPARRARPALGDRAARDRGGAFLGGEVYLPLMLHAERGLSLTQAGAVLTGGALAWSLGSWIVGRKTYDRTLVLSVGPLVMGGDCC
nr:hypothetical protein GCM10020093_037250 [Planobispora longispora]